MKTLNMSFGTVIAICASLLFSNAASAGHHKEGETKPATVVDIAVAAEATSTLVAAVKAAGLVDVLSGEGPFTVLAPTNEAFANLPEGALDGLLADPEALASVLKAHVIAGKVKAASVLASKEVQTLNGTYGVVVADGRVAIAGANVIATDLMAKNGVVHLIDTVILPK
jgi:uncharacterized surface protein with fasciclin (FAS1) repeats